jgi:hypothetical protein
LMYYLPLISQHQWGHGQLEVPGPLASSVLLSNCFLHLPEAQSLLFWLMEQKLQQQSKKTISR